MAEANPPFALAWPRKTELIRDVASWKSLAIDDAAPLFDSFVYGIGDPGLVYNTGRPNELTYLARFSIEVIAKETGARTELLAHNWAWLIPQLVGWVEPFAKPIDP